jgi:putative addiction module antidote
MLVFFVRKLTKVGNSLRVVIPKEIADTLRLEAGDRLAVALDDTRITMCKLKPKKEVMVTEETGR